MVFQPRWYQSESVQAVYDYLNKHKEGNPCVELPTGAGKTYCLTSICADVAGKWGGRVLVLAHVKELLQQAADTLNKVLPLGSVGIYSAGLKKRDTTHDVIVGGIQSVYKKAGSLGKFDIIIVDEAHLIPAHEGGMYRDFLEAAAVVNPKVRIVGLTATPYRLDTGYVCSPDNILNEICYSVGVKDLILQGYLCPLRSKSGKEHADLSGVHLRGGEFIPAEMAEAMGAVITPACTEIVQLTEDRHSVLVFSAGVAHGQEVCEKLKELAPNERVEFICADTPDGERAAILEDFKQQRIKYLVNVNVLTTGFDAPCVDAIALLRATKSPGLYYQMVGRGLRMHESKADCLILDYGENIITHGCVDNIQIKDKTQQGEGEAPCRECPECQEVCFAGLSVCPSCGFVFPIKEDKHEDRASRAGVLSGQIEQTTLQVVDMMFFEHEKRGNPDAPHTLRVDYLTDWQGSKKSQWLCFDHTGFARQKAENWWRDMSDYPCPESVKEALEFCNAGATADVSELTWTQEAGAKFGEITGIVIGEKPKLEEVEKTLGARATAKVGEDWFDEFADDIPF